MKPILALFLSLTSPLTFALNLQPTDSSFYYRLGGSSNLYLPPIKNDYTLRIGASAESRLGFSCNGFNSAITIHNSLQDIKNSASNLPQGLIQNLTYAIGGFPLYKLQQSDPGLYNVIQNTAAFGHNEFSLKVADCQRVESNLAAGLSPVESVLSISDSQGWLDAAKRAKTQKVDVVETSKLIAQQRDDYGLPWIGQEKGNAGGKQQRPIAVIEDVVIAGYNILLKRTPLTNTTAANPLDSPLSLTWKSPVEAANWAVKVLGEIRLSTSEANHDSVAGLGLSALLLSCEGSNSCTKTLTKNLWQLVDGNLPLTEAHLQQVSSSNLRLSDEIILNLRQQNKESQLFLVSKLAEDIALQNLLEKALMLRRILYAGLQVQAVQSLKPALDMVRFALKKLDSDIETLSFEGNVRANMSSKTLKLIMTLHEKSLQSAHPHTINSAATIQNGAIYTQGAADGRF